MSGHMDSTHRRREIPLHLRAKFQIVNVWRFFLGRM